MILNVTIPDHLVERLQSIARASSRTPEQVAVSAIERDLSAWDRADKALAPVHDAFEASGMTDDELSEFLEAEKHAMRRERRAAGEP